MKGALYFIAGVLVGLGGGYLIGKKKKNKQQDNVVLVHHAGEGDERYEERDKQIEEDKEVERVAKRNGYITEDDDEYFDYDQDDLQNDIDAIDDYLGETEHPEDDEPLVREDFVQISDDEFFTERHEFDKVTLVLDASGSELRDSLGNDYIDIFAEHGISAEQLMKDAVKNDYTVYYRNDRLESDYEVLYEGGE